MRRAACHICVIAALAALLGPTAGAGEYTFQYQKTIDMSGPLELSLELATGSVQVTSGEVDRLVIEAVKRVKAVDKQEAEEVADHIEIRVDQNKNQVAVATNYLRMGSRSRSFWQKLLGSGPDSFGEVDYTITVPATKKLLIKAMSAQVALSNIEADIEVDNAAGVFHGEFLSGPVTIRQPAGRIDLQWVEGDIRISSTSAEIGVSQVRGALDLTSRTGDINIKTELNSPNDFYVETETGRIVFAVPETSSGRFQIESQAGGIASEVPLAIISAARHRFVGEYGTGGPKVTLHTASGDVTLAMY